jgi:hypothetical protein
MLVALKAASFPPYEMTDSWDETGRGMGREERATDRQKVRCLGAIDVVIVFGLFQTELVSNWRQQGQAGRSRDGIRWLTFCAVLPDISNALCPEGRRVILHELLRFGILFVLLFLSLARLQGFSRCKEGEGETSSSGCLQLPMRVNGEIVTSLPTTTLLERTHPLGKMVRARKGQSPGAHLLMVDPAFTTEFSPTIE